MTFYLLLWRADGLQVGRLENAIGWYHSHPGYGCWLSGIDVGTQMLNQQFQEPFVAIVVKNAVQCYCPLEFVVWAALLQLNCLCMC